MAVQREDFNAELAPYVARQAHEVGLAIALRSCLRVLPDMKRTLGKSRQGVDAQQLLIALRFCLTLHTHLAVPREVTNGVVMESAQNLGNGNEAGPVADMLATAEAMDRAAERAALVPAIVAGTGYHGQERLDSAIADRNFIEVHPFSVLLSERLWDTEPVAIRDELEGLWSVAEGFVAKGAWDFWRKWYQRTFDGDSPDWELQRDIALIPDVDWGKGAEHIARLIAEIEAHNLARRLPLAEEVELNPESRLFRLVPIPLDAQALVGALLTQVGDALDDALADPSNGLSERSRETRVLRRTIQRYGNDPQRIEMDCVSVAVGLRRQLETTEELPKSEENLGLLATVEECALGIRANHPEVAANRNVLAQQRMRELGPADRTLLEDALPILTAISEGALESDFRDDLPEVIELIGLPAYAEAVPTPEMTRTFSRIAKLKLAYGATVEKGAAIFDSKTVKTARLGELLISLVRLGLRLLGVL